MTMANFSSAHLHNEAAKLGRKHPADNPLLNPSAKAQLSTKQLALVDAIANTPSAAALATTPVSGAPSGDAATGTATGRPGPGTRGATPLSSHTLYRSPRTRHNLCGFLVPPGGGTIAANIPTGVACVPQTAFVASDAMVSPLTLQLGTVQSNGIGQWKVGERSQFVATTLEPMRMYAAGLGAGRLRFTKCAAAIAISAQVNMTATGTFYGCLVGSAGSRKDNKRPPPEYAKESRLPIAPQLIAPGASGTIVTTPTRNFWPTMILLDDNGTGQFGEAVGDGASNFVLPDLLVGSDSQFMHAPAGPTGTPYVPAGIFNNLKPLPIDFDMVKPAIGMSFEYLNAGSVSAWFSGVVLGDTDKREDVQSDDISLDD
jgi:hypothetical protein